MRKLGPRVHLIPGCQAQGLYTVMPPTLLTLRDLRIKKKINITTAAVISVAITATVNPYSIAIS